jgi:hypothetical protein
VSEVDHSSDIGNVTWCLYRPSLMLLQHLFSPSRVSPVPTPIPHRLVTPLFCCLVMWWTCWRGRRMAR